MKQKQSNHDMRNWFLGTIAVGAIPLIGFAAEKLGVFDKKLEQKVSEPTAVVQEHVPEVNDVNYVNEVQEVNKVKKVDYEPVKKIIVLDPGHGMNNRKQGIYDPGAVADPNEAEIVLNQANKIKDILQNKGYRVILTRINNSKGINYKQRAKFAKDNNADIFVSLHCNAFDDESVYGQETFYKNENSKKLADYIQSSLVNNINKKFKTKDRGIKKRNLRVLDSEIPSVLVESGFLTNKNDRTYLTDKINDVEQGIANGIDNYLKEGFK